MKAFVKTSAVWLRTAHHPTMRDLVKLEVLLEIEGKWKLAIESYVPKFEAEVSHIRETEGTL